MVASTTKALGQLPPDDNGSSLCQKGLKQLDAFRQPFTKPSRGHQPILQHCSMSFDIYSGGGRAGRERISSKFAPALKQTALCPCHSYILAASHREYQKVHLELKKHATAATKTTRRRSNLCCRRFLSSVTPFVASSSVSSRFWSAVAWPAVLLETSSWRRRSSACRQVYGQCRCHCCCCHPCLQKFRGENLV